MTSVRYRRKRVFNQELYDHDAHQLFIATEGEKTERQYFSVFRSRKVKIIILGSISGESAPLQTLERLDKAIADYEIDERDELWLMLDVDHWAQPNHITNLKRVVQDARNKGFQLALSNPSFECWLLLHFQDVDGSKPVTLKWLESQLRKHTPGHRKSSLKTNFYTPDRVREAIRRAETLDVAPNEPWPTSTGTRVYRTVRRILRLGVAELSS